MRGAAVNGGKAKLKVIECGRDGREGWLVTAPAARRSILNQRKISNNAFAKNSIGSDIPGRRGLRRFESSAV